MCAVFFHPLCRFEPLSLKPALRPSEVVKMQQQLTVNATSTEPSSSSSVCPHPPDSSGTCTCTYMYTCKYTCTSDTLSVLIAQLRCTMYRHVQCTFLQGSSFGKCLVYNHALFVTILYTCMYSRSQKKVTISVLSVAICFKTDTPFRFVPVSNVKKRTFRPYLYHFASKLAM